MGPALTTVLMDTHSHWSMLNGTITLVKHSPQSQVLDGL
uniref:Uncharacterized protein n=1 Tax=Moniliophthora roreri TaxID=221103 RepID=A0A0W0F7R3_MONRR